MGGGSTLKWGHARMLARSSRQKGVGGCRFGLVLWNNRLELQRLFSGELQFTVDSEPRPVKVA